MGGGGEFPEWFIGSEKEAEMALHSSGSPGRLGGIVSTGLTTLATRTKTHPGQR